MPPTLPAAEGGESEECADVFARDAFGDELGLFGHPATLRGEECDERDGEPRGLDPHGGAHEREAGAFRRSAAAHEEVGESAAAGAAGVGSEKRDPRHQADHREREAAGVLQVSQASRTRKNAVGSVRKRARKNPRHSEWRSSAHIN